jgi:signal transduction histidine kinase
LASKATRKQSLLYVALLAACMVLGVLAGLTPIGIRIDHYFYDVLSTFAAKSAQSGGISSVVVAINEETFDAGGGPRRMRPILADVVTRIAEAGPRAVAVDVILHDQGDPAEDEQLAAALRRIPKLVLDCEVVNDKWEYPAPLFRAAAFGIGHVHLPTDREDGVSRQIPLEIAVNGDRRWALALETFLASRGQRGPDEESPEDLRIGSMVVPAPRARDSRALSIRYVPAGIPTVSALHFDPKDVRDRVVFLGVTAASAARDRLVNPYGTFVTGVTVHAHAYETLTAGKFLVPVGDLTRWLWWIALCASAGLIFAYLSGWRAYAVGFLVLAAAHAAPVLYFANGIVFPYFGLISVAWLSTVGAASYQYLFVQRALSKSESEKSRYQQAIHWVAHEMRTPLTAIQGSSEIMSRYNLPEEKRHQLSEMINSESKRMARMIQTFLDIERLADGQMELKREPFNIADVASSCFKRALPLAERKQISLVLDTSMDASLLGDRELMEYALYNLLTNAIKYSPKETDVHVFFMQRGAELRLSVRDQGMGMDADEQKRIFNKFYRTKGAEKSGEVGTGIGLSIVEQIVSHHGGRIEVASEPGKGSCFTMVLKAEVAATPNAETADRGR